MDTGKTGLKLWITLFWSAGIFLDWYNSSTRKEIHGILYIDLGKANNWFPSCSTPMITVISKLGPPGATYWPCCGFSEISCHILLLNVFLHLDKLIANVLHLFKASESCHIYQLIWPMFCRKYRTGGGNLHLYFQHHCIQMGPRSVFLSGHLVMAFVEIGGAATAVYHQWCLAHGTLSVDLTPRFWTWIGVTTEQQARGWGLFIVRSKASRWQDDVLYGCPLVLPSVLWKLTKGLPAQHMSNYL